MTRPTHTPELELPPTVAEIGKIHFEGNVIPHTWYQYIKLKSRKPDTVGITILAEIVYWYRPIVIIDEQTGRQVICKKKFSGDKFRSPIAYYEQKFGFSVDQVRQALKRLERGGFILREYRDYEFGGLKTANVTYVEPVAEAILRITHPTVEPTVGVPEGAVSIPQGEVLIPHSAVPTPHPEVPIPRIIDFYKTTTDKTTTTTAAASVGEGSRGSWIYPHELLPEEQVEAAKMLAELETDLAQQVLDELAGQIQAKTVKCPLAYLRALVTNAKIGAFTATAAVRIQEKRRRTRSGTKTSTVVKTMPTDREAGRQKLAAIRKRVKSSVKAG